MKQEHQVTLINRMLSLLDADDTDRTGVMLQTPASAFTSKDLAAQEWTTFFQGQPQIIGLSADLPKSGSYLTNNDLGVPILATRDKTGKFRAFVNSCRHRGATVVLDERGEGNRFSCIFHGWSYANDGSLIGVKRTDSFGAPDKSCLGLVELPSAEKHGLLVVRAKGDDAVDVDALLGENLACELETWDFGASTYMSTQKIEMPLNWKLANDTYGENYHFENLHKETVNKIFIGNTATFDAFGQNHRLGVPNRYLYNLRERPQTQWNASDAAAVAYFVFPNTHIVLFNRVVSVFIIYPVQGDPGASYTKAYHYAAQHIGAEIADKPGAEITGDGALYDADSSTRVEFNQAAAEELADTTIEDEDYWAGTMTQTSANSGKIEYFVLGRNEPGIQHMHQAYRVGLGLPPLDEYRPSS
jgi:phenylpropionate dioxygenase-like ring-hydroxylating dioxygenase large terminal subunit